MDKLIRSLLLLTCLIYYFVCVAAGLEINVTLHQVLIVLFIVFGVIVVIRYMVLLIAAVLEKKLSMTGKLASNLQNWKPFISIIVPAYNEENLIEAALESLARLTYPNYEIIVIDDGSTDNTLSIAQKIADHNPHIGFKLISQSNAGKSWALNTGIIHAQGEIVVCVDSDSRLNSEALLAGIPHFNNPKVGAVGGFVDIINRNTLITNLQQLEYVIGLNFMRRGLSLFNIVTIVPGPIGMFRKEAIVQAGGYSTNADCFAEDADLTVRLLANGWQVKGETRMVAQTEAPDSIFNLLRQRYRWKRGIFQACYNNFFRLITLPNISGLFVAGILVFESFLFDVINFGITLFAISSFLAYGKVAIFIWAFLFISALDLTVFLFANIEQNHLLRRFWLFMLSKLTYAYMLQAWGIFALFDEWLSTKMSWDKLERIGGTAFQGNP